MTVVVEPEPPEIKISHDGGDGEGTDDGGRHGGGDGNGGEPDSAPSRDNDDKSHIVLGMFIFIVTEFIFFGALALIFLLARGSHTQWPPPGQPRLPMAVTGVNTLILLASGYTMYLARKNIRQDKKEALKQWLFITAGLGCAFLAVQGAEWLRLLRFGLDVAGNLYAATFYVIIGAHALHVFIAVIGLLFVWRRALAYAYSAAHHTGVTLCQMFWLFVVFIWPMLYTVVYLI